MSASLLNNLVHTRTPSTTPPPLPMPMRILETDEVGDVRNAQWPLVLSAAFGSSLLLHVFVLVLLAFWFLHSKSDDKLAVDSGIAVPKTVESMDLSIPKLAVTVSKKRNRDRSAPSFARAVNRTARLDGPSISIPFPNAGGSGEGGGGGGHGKGIFGSGREANSFVFVVDCSSSMLIANRFDRAVAELLRVIDYAGRSEMSLCGAVAKRRLGELLDGSSGQLYRQESDAWMKEQRVVNPARFAEVAAPGFRPTESANRMLDPARISG